ncbi:hypothetical protein [Burkholderia gladioli]|nr:hypothetical protein [Burkholderia gladioli]
MYTNSNSSPLEHLAAFAIVLVSAVIGTTAIAMYIGTLRRETKQAPVTAC